MGSPVNTDAVIVGAGPCGLFAAFQLGIHGLQAHVVDALDRVGGQCIELYPDKPIYDIPALPSVQAGELIGRLAAQAAPFAPRFHMGARVVALEPQPDGRWQVAVDSGAVFSTSVVVLATGGGSFTPRTPPNLSGLRAFEGTGVRYAVPRVDDHRGEQVVIAGGGDSAVDWAVELSSVAAGVVLVHQRDELRAQPHNAARLQALVDAGKIRRLTGRVVGLHGDAPRLEAVSVKGREEEARLATDRLLVFFGFVMQESPIAGIGLDLVDGLVPVSTETFESGLPGLFAVGDAATYPGKLKLILSGFHEAALMAAAAARRCRPGLQLPFEYSTSSVRFRDIAGPIRAGDPS